MLFSEITAEQYSSSYILALRILKTLIPDTVIDHHEITQQAVEIFYKRKLKRKFMKSAVIDALRLFRNVRRQKNKVFEDFYGLDQIAIENKNIAILEQKIDFNRLYDKNKERLLGIERKVIAGILEGKNNQEIADILGVHYSYISNTKKEIIRKFRNEV